jgi:hypothetical protein
LNFTRRLVLAISLEVIDIKIVFPINYIFYSEPKAYLLQANWQLFWLVFADHSPDALMKSKRMSSGRLKAPNA